jgi:hypothetical protein
MPLSTMLFVGTDVSQATNRTRFFDGAGDEVGRRYQSANDLPGSKALAAEALGRADRAWLERLITRRLPLEDFEQAVERQPDDIKVVLDL